MKLIFCIDGDALRQQTWAFKSNFRVLLSSIIMNLENFWLVKKTPPVDLHWTLCLWARFGSLCWEMTWSIKNMHSSWTVWKVLAINQKFVFKEMWLVGPSGRIEYSISRWIKWNNACCYKSILSWLAKWFHMLSG